MVIVLLAFENTLQAYLVMGMNAKMYKLQIGQQANVN